MSVIHTNGAAAEQSAAADLPEQGQVIEALTEALAAAKGGLLTSVAILSAGAGGMNVAVAGPQVADLYLAAGSFQAKVIQVFNDPAPKTKSSIIRSGR